MINKIRKSFDGKVIRTFVRKRLDIDAQFVDEISFEEDKDKSKDALLKRLIIQHRKAQEEILGGNQLKDAVIIQTDMSDEKFARYSLFFHKDAHLYASTCDFVIMKVSGDTLYVAVCEMKSSRKGDNNRCKRQVENTKLFFDYVLRAAIASDEYKKQDGKKKDAVQLLRDYQFLKVIFIPEAPPIALSMPVNVGTEDQGVFKLNKNSKAEELRTNFHTVKTNSDFAAIVPWADIEKRFPA